METLATLPRKPAKTESMAHVETDRRTFLSRGIAAVVPGLRATPAAEWQRARAIVRRGGLGQIAYCRMSGGNCYEMVDALQFVFDGALPVSVAAQKCSGALRMATFHYAGFIASWEDHPGGARAMSVHGADATLTLFALPNPHSPWKLEVSSS
jgi:hypothetical protein